MKPETKYTLLILGLAIIWKMLLLLTGQVEGLMGKYPLLPVLGFMLIGMYRGMEERRKLSYTEGIRFRDAFKSGMSIAVLFTLIYSLFLYVYMQYLDLAFKSRFITARIEELKKDGTNQIDIDAWIQTTQSFPFVTAWMLFSFIGMMLIGIFYSLAISRMMIRKYPFRAQV